MKWNGGVFKHLEIKQSLLLLFLSISIINFCVGLVMLYSLRDLGGRFANLKSNDLNSITYLNQVERALLKLRVSSSNYAVQKSEERKDVLRQESEWFAEIDQGMISFLPLAITHLEKENLKKWNMAYASYVENRKTLLRMIDSGHLKEADQYKIAHIMPVASQAEKTMERLISFQSEEVERKQREVTEDIQKKDSVITSLIFFSVLLAGMITWLAVHWIAETHMQRMEALNKVSSVGDMAGNLAHEINNPLAMIMMTAEQLEALSSREQLEGSLLAKQVKRITVASNRIRKLTSGLRTFARDGSADPFVDFDIKNMIDETMAFCADKIRRHSVEFSAEYLSENLRLEGRATQLSQVIVNLVGNAVDAVETRKDKWVRLQVRELENHLEVSITESGERIPQDIRDKMFKTSFTTKPVGRGTGLGLGICARIVDEHRGRIYVDERSPSTRIVIELPKSRDPVKLAA